jgi:hypothetical protein
MANLLQKWTRFLNLMQSPFFATLTSLVQGLQNAAASKSISAFLIMWEDFLLRWSLLRSRDQRYWRAPAPIP